MAATAVSPRVLDTKDAALYLGCSAQFLKKHRTVGTIKGKCEGPAWVKVGPRRVGYLVEDLDTYLESRRVSQ